MVINNQMQPIVSDKIGLEGDRSGTVKKVGTATLVGAAFGEADKGLAGGAALAFLTPGKQVHFKAGTLLEFRISQPLANKQ